jgi:hypothetical protein
MRALIALGFSLVVMGAQAQVTIAGHVRDTKGRPVAGASIAIKDAYDGGTSDSTGHFQFHSTEKGEHVLLTTSIGFKLAEQKIILNQSSISIDVVLKEETSELKAVVVSAGTFEASDTKRATVLNPIDIVTTASANADVTAAIKTLPGPQQIGEQEGLFVRGGTAQETKVYIDGTQVNNFYFSSVPDIAQRGRFSPFIFKGTVFSSGGYSALYGQALSSVLLLESVDLPEKSSASLSISTVGVSAGVQKLNKKKTASWGIAYSYTNLLPYFAVVSQKPDYVTIPEFHNGEANFRIKTSKTGMLKFYSYFNLNRLGFRTPDIDSMGVKDAFSLKNFNVYSNLSWKENLGRHWRLFVGSSYSSNTDQYNQQLEDHDDNVLNIPYEPYASKIYDLKSSGELAQIKTVLEKRFGALSAIRFGGEYLMSKDKADFTDPYVTHGISSFDDHFAAAFAESDIYVTNNLAAKIGGRVEHSSYLDKWNMVPRISLAQKVGVQGQVSLAYGIFYEKPERQYLLFRNNLDYSKATHYILNYQKVTRDYTLRTELFYKKYHGLIKTVPDTNNAGYGEAKGIEIFWRDRKSIKNIDYWISYSYLDTKRDYLNFPFAMQPNFATHHTASLVVKKFVTKLKTQFNGSYTFATGRPYYDLRYDAGDNKVKIYDQGKTVSYNNLSFSINYLPDVFKKNARRFTVFVFSVTNVLGSNLVYGYNYSSNGQVKQAVTPPAKRFYFFGCFLSFGVDRSEDVINSNL